MGQSFYVQMFHIRFFFKGFCGLKKTAWTVQIVSARVIWCVCHCVSQGDLVCPSARVCLSLCQPGWFGVSVTVSVRVIWCVCHYQPGWFGVSVTVSQGDLVSLSARVIWCVCHCQPGWFGVSVTVSQGNLVCLSTRVIWCVCQPEWFGVSVTVIQGDLVCLSTRVILCVCHCQPGWFGVSVNQGDLVCLSTRVIWCVCQPEWFGVSVTVIQGDLVCLSTRVILCVCHCQPGWFGVSVNQGDLVCLSTRVIWCVCQPEWFGVSVTVIQGDLVCLSLSAKMICCVCQPGWFGVSVNHGDWLPDTALRKGFCCSWSIHMQLIFTEEQATPPSPPPLCNQKKMNNKITWRNVWEFMQMVTSCFSCVQFSMASPYWTKHTWHITSVLYIAWGGDSSVGRVSDWKARYNTDPDSRIFLAVQTLLQCLHSHCVQLHASTSVHIKNPKHWQQFHCLIAWKYCTHIGMGSTALGGAVPYLDKVTVSSRKG